MKRIVVYRILMRYIAIPRCIVGAALLLGYTTVMTAKDVDKFTLPTPWAEDALAAEVPLPEYPRPQMERNLWMNLNGMWDYAGGEKLPDPSTATTPYTFSGKTEQIRVPYPPEAELSGIVRNGDTRLWYRRTFVVPKEWKGKHVLLHFGAVDRISSVFVNGKKVGSHTGGFDSFSFDITDYLKPGENTLVVGAYDPNDGRAPSGKNSPIGDYTFTSGIWQTVWLEPVEKQHISDIRLVPDVENSRLKITVNSGNPALTVTATASDGTVMVAEASASADKAFYLPISNPRLWSPDDPFLYDLKLQLKDRKGKVVDEVKSYFGMRSIKLGKVDGVTRPLLNGEFVFQLGLLDQGYWPEGSYTAPTEEALKYDIELAKRAGFNVIRKHIKVEPQRWYYNCDKLGMMVWQDMPNIWYADGPDSLTVRQAFRHELKTMIDQHANSPSIVMWVPFNENWGIFDSANITDAVKKQDPSRLVNGNSGFNETPDFCRIEGDPGNGDFVDRHCYRKLEPGSMPKPTDTRAASLGEFGGKGLFVRGHMWPVRNNAYEIMISKNHLTDTYVMLATELEQMINYFGLSTAIYTQTTDVEHEVNGLVTYDRKVEKMDLDKVAAINRDIIKCTRRKP